MTEAVRAVEQLCFDNSRQRALRFAVTSAINASRRVAERAGYTLEGVLRCDDRAPAGELRNTCIYGKIAPAT
jgi:RimJ/RimL family protein N-acetyltransferase